MVSQSGVVLASGMGVLTGGVVAEGCTGAVCIALGVGGVVCALVTGRGSGFAAVVFLTAGVVLQAVRNSAVLNKPINTLMAPNLIVVFFTMNNLVSDPLAGAHLRW